MCGLVGVYRPRGAASVAAPLERMLGCVAHRGPDGRAIHASGDGRFAVGFARLAIIDLETGDQPLVEPDSGRVLAGNGEIYNFTELRARHADYPFRTRGDMEPVLAAYRQDGAACLNDLRGMFGLALYDPGPRRLLLARDRLGIKPLYWADLPGGGLLFGSEIKPLLASGVLARAVDETAVAAYLAHGYVPAPDTLYAGIRKLPPGHRLIADPDGRVSVECYWRPAPAADGPASPEDIRAHLLETLADSVRLHLRSDVPAGALLSGGLDSGLLVALAARQLDRPLKTFTVRFAEAPVDESPLAALVAERYATEHTVYDLPSGRIRDHLPALAWHADDPLADAALLPNHLIEQAVGRSLRVVLNGTGGDELFAGYGRYFQPPVEARYLRLPAWARRGMVEPLLDRLAPQTAWKLRRAVLFEADPGAYLHAHSTYFPPPLWAALGGRLTRPGAAQARVLSGTGGDRQTRSLLADLQTYLPEDLLTLLDRTTMASGVEGRVPFLDHPFVEAALVVPPEVRTPGGRQKGLQRALARGLLPDAVLDAPKRGFASPVGAWLRAGLAPLARRLLMAPKTLDRGWWSAIAIDRLLADPERHGHRVYALMMLELAVRMHAEDTPSGCPNVDLETYLDAA